MPPMSAARSHVPSGAVQKRFLQVGQVPALLAGLVGVLLTASCPSDDEDDVPRADEYFYDCTTAPATLKIYATDESFRAIVDKESAGGAVPDQRAPSLLAPGTGSMLSASNPPEFSLNVPVSALPSAAPGKLVQRGASPLLRDTWPSSWRELASDLWPIGTAHAHCGNVTGENYMLRLVPSGQTKPVYTALLSVRTFTPGAAVWKRIMEPRKGQTLQLFLMRAVLVDGRVMDGPFVSAQPVNFTVGD